jgi:histone-lysine N-methyltransferase SETMAR
MYIVVFHRPRDAVTRKHPEKWRTNILYLLYGNAAAHWSILVKCFVAKNSVATLGHPPYSPDLAAPNSYLFRQLKSALKGRLFCNATDIVNLLAPEFFKFF